MPLALTPHDYQRLAIEDSLDWFASAGPSDRRLYAAPTGTGKSVIELAIQEALGEGAWVVTPRLEIIAGMLAKLGWKQGDESQQTVINLGESCRIATPVRLRNRLLRGEGPVPERLIIDESHHDTASTWQQIHLCSQAPAVGFTATPFRGTPRGTAEFRKQWGEPVWVITIREAAARGVLSLPRCEIVPLVDDETITVRAGEFVAEAVTDATRSRLADGAALIAETWDIARRRPTMVSLPNTDTAHLFSDELTRCGVENRVITADTPHADRRAAFDACVRSEAILLQINVVSEGVDLPVRRLYDFSPCLSPVRWLQQLGRITRPVGPCEDPPEYYCTNRNLLRHAYLLEGCLPPEVIAAGVKAFGGVGKYAALRAVGLEALGRLKAIELPLADGTEGLCYSVSRVEDNRVLQYCCLVHPLKEEPVWARRTNQRGEEGETVKYGRWSRCEAPEGLEGFASNPPAPLSEKQESWWKSHARRHGLDASAKVTRKNFTALPVLSDLRIAL